MPDIHRQQATTLNGLRQLRGIQMGTAHTTMVFRAVLPGAESGLSSPGSANRAPSSTRRRDVASRGCPTASPRALCHPRGSCVPGRWGREVTGAWRCRGQHALAPTGGRKGRGVIGARRCSCQSSVPPTRGRWGRGVIGARRCSCQSSVPPTGGRWGRGGGRDAVL